MKNISKFSKQFSLSVVGSVFSILMFPSKSMGLSSIQAGALSVRSNDQPMNLFGATGVFTTISNTAMFIVGALSVIMLIFGGLKYVVSAGDATKVTGAKNTILYAIIGVIVATLAYAAISFVTTQLGASSTANIGTNL